MVPSEKMLSVKEVADRLAVSPDTVRRLIRAEMMEAWKLPSRSMKRRRVFVVYRVAETEVRRFIDRCTVGPIRRRA